MATDSSDKDAKPTALKSSSHIGFLDQCRGVAILLVFLTHCITDFPVRLKLALHNPVGVISDFASGKLDSHFLLQFLAFYPCRLGWSGVAVFFVVSGFCIHLSYFQSAKPNFTTFYVRRFFRLYPAYLLSILLFGILLPACRFPLAEFMHWDQFGAHLLLCQNLWHSFTWHIDPVYWSIAVEAQLYLLFPILLVVVRRYSFTNALLLLGAVEFGLHLTTVLFFEGGDRVPPALLRNSPFFYWFSWAIGAAIADAYLKRKPLPFRGISPLVWLIAAIATSGFSATEFSFSFFALSTASLLARHLSRSLSEEKMSLLSRFLRLTGTYSYSIYLIHYPIIKVVVSSCGRILPGLEKHPIQIFCAGLSSWLIIFPLAALIYHSVEKPGISLGRKLLASWWQRLADRSSANTRSAADIVSGRPA